MAAYEETVSRRSKYKLHTLVFVKRFLKKGTKQMCIRGSGGSDELSEVAILSGDPRLPEDGGDERNKIPDETERHEPLRSS